MLPVRQLLLLRYVVFGGKGRLLLVAVGLIGVTFVHQLGVAFFGLTVVAFGVLRLARSPSRTTLLRFSLVILLVAFAALVPLQQRADYVAAGNESIVAPTTLGESVNLGSTRYGLWVSPEQPAFYAVHPSVLLRQPVLLLAFILAPVLFFWRRLRTAGDQFLVAMVLLNLLVFYNPFVAPWLGRIISFPLVFRTSWLATLPAALLLARMAVLGVGSIRLWLTHRGQTTRRSSLILRMTPCLILIIAAVFTTPRIAAGVALLHDFRTAGFTPQELDTLRFLRESGKQDSLVWANWRLIDEIPPVVGHAYGPYFRHKRTARDVVGSIRSFYEHPWIEPLRLSTLAHATPDYVIVDNDSGAEQQLSELPDAFQQVYANSHFTIYQRAPGAEESEPMRSLSEAYDAAQDGEFAVALATVEGVLELWPENQTAQVLKSDLLLRMGRIEEALDLARRIASQNSTDLWADQYLAAQLVKQAKYLTTQRDYSGVARAYQEALDLAPDNAEAGEGLVTLYAFGGDVLVPGAWRERALSAIASIPIDRSEFSHLDRQQILWRQAKANEQLGQLSESIALLQQAADIARPFEPEAFLQIADFYRRTGDVVSAETFYRRAIAADPTDPQSYFALANMLSETYGPDAYFVTLREAAASNAYSAWPLVALGRRIVGQELVPSGR